MHKHLQPGQPAPNATVLDINGQPFQLATLWQSGPVLLSFLRHFGCIFCRQWLAQLEQHHAELQAAGVQLAAVGLGEPKHAQRYCGQLAPNVTCVVNVTKEAYTAFGIARGNLTQLAGPSVILNAAKATAQGFTQGLATGDTHMIGGTFVIDQHGIIRFAHYDAHAGDHPEFSEIFRAVKELQPVA